MAWTSRPCCRARDRRHLLLYFRDDALWLTGADGSAPARIIGAIPNAPAPFGYYGHVDWSDALPLAWDQA